MRIQYIQKRSLNLQTDVFFVPLIGTVFFAFKYRSVEWKVQISVVKIQSPFWGCILNITIRGVWFVKINKKSAESKQLSRNKKFVEFNHQSDIHDDPPIVIKFWMSNSLLKTKQEIILTKYCAVSLSIVHWASHDLNTNYKNYSIFHEFGFFIHKKKNDAFWDLISGTYKLKIYLL